MTRPSQHVHECVSAHIDDCFNRGFCKCECGETWPIERSVGSSRVEHTPIPTRPSSQESAPQRCEFCRHYPSYTAAPGVACQRCLRVGVGDVRSDSRPPTPRENLAAQEELVAMVPRTEPYGLPDMMAVERILAVFGFNVCEVQ